MRLAAFLLFLALAALVAYVAGPEEVRAFLEMHHALTMEYSVLIAGVLFVLYTLAFAFTVPVTTVLALAVGFLYGPAIGFALVMGATVVGALGTYFFARDLAPVFCTKILGTSHDRFLREAEAHPFSYLLTTRFAPLVPFTAAHLVPALSGVKVRDFFVVTLIGTAPASLAFVAVGHGLMYSAMGQGLATGSALLALSGLSLAVLIPILLRRAYATKKS